MRGRRDLGRYLWEEHPTRGDGKVKSSGGRRGSWPKSLKRSKDKGPAGAEQTEQRVKGGHVQTVNRACETGLYSPCMCFHH